MVSFRCGIVVSFGGRVLRFGCKARSAAVYDMLVYNAQCKYK